MRRFVAIACGLLAGATLANPPQTRDVEWRQLGGGPDHAGRTFATGPRQLAQPRWVASTDEVGDPITFIGPAGVVATRDLVLAVGFTGPDDRLFAFDAADGSVVWSAVVPIAAFDSWSTPAIDGANATAIVASDAFVTAVDLHTGAPQWSTPLESVVVNASPVVTTDLGPRDRVFITDYGFVGSGEGRLYCINADTFDAIENPFQPGELVWSVGLGAPTSGNTPAYANGTVFVATPGSTAQRGQVLAFDATATTAPAPAWAATNPEPFGFFGGVTVSRRGVYAASYGFGFGPREGNLLKLDAETGDFSWSIRTNRTSSSPIVLPDRRVVLSTGFLDDPLFPPTGSAPSLVLLRDLGSEVEELWDSAAATHDDLNNNGLVDQGEPYLALGGWTHHPAAVRRGEGINAWSVIVGTLPSESSTFFDAYDRIARVDLARHPTEPGFVSTSGTGFGSTPAVVGGRAYTVGTSGLAAFGPAQATTAQRTTSLTPAGMTEEGDARSRR